MLNISKTKLFNSIKKNKAGMFFWFVFVVILISINLAGNVVYGKFFNQVNQEASSDSETSGNSKSNSECNVQGVSLHGEIVTYNSHDAFNDMGVLKYDQTSADEVIWTVKHAEKEDNIKAIIAEIDSPGGSPTAGEEIMRAFKDSKKPVVAYIRNRGLSTAYLGATGAETIFASKLSDVGSIGVTMSYLQETEKNKKEGLEYITLSSGKFKDAGSPSRTITNEEKQLFMRDIKIGYQNFLSFVSENRNLDIEKVKKLADGSSMMGEAALKEGLIDRIGLLPDVENYISEKIGDKVEVCW